MRYLYILILYLFGSVGVLANSEFSDSEIRAHTRVLDVHASSILIETRATLRGLANILTRADLSGKEAHDLFNKTAKELKGARAILYLDAKGNLEVDSFSYPLFPRNLSDREYFKFAKDLPDGQLYIGEQKMGRNSGIPFVPVSMAVQADSELKGVLTAIITPPLFLAYQDPFSCLYCLSMLVDLQGKPIAKYPINLELPETVTDKFKFDDKPAEGIETVKVGALQARIYWIRNKEFPIISVFLEFIGN